MAHIDFNEIATAHNSVRGNPQRGLRVNDTKLTMIKLKAASPVEWSPPYMTPTFNNLGASRSTNSATASSNEDMKEVAAVSITQGLCKGLNTKVKVPFPGEMAESHVLDIDPCDHNRQHKTYTTPVALTSAPRGQSGRVESRLIKQEYHGVFTCRVYPTGSILKEAQTRGGALTHVQIKTQTVIAELKDANPQSVRDLHEDERGFYFIMKGQCNLKLDA